MKRVSTFLAVLATLATITLATMPQANAATCEGGNGTTCEGECCKGGPNGCLAGPCSAFPKV